MIKPTIASGDDEKAAKLLAWRRYKLAIEKVYNEASHLNDASLFSEDERNEISALDDQVIHFLNKFRGPFTPNYERGKLPI